MHWTWWENSFKNNESSNQTRKSNEKIRLVSATVFRSMALPTRFIGFHEVVIVSVFKTRCCRLIHDHRGVRMKLQNRCRTYRTQRTFSQSRNSVCFVITRGQQHQMPATANRAQALG